MEQKYFIRSASTIVSMVVTFADENNQLSTVAVNVDMANDRVYFAEKTDGFDYDDLEQEILKHLRPEGLEAPKLSPEMVKQINDIKRGVFEGQSIKNQR